MMNNKQTKILAIMAFSAAQSTSGFVVNTPPSHVASSTNTIGIRRPLFSTVEDTTSSASSSSSDIVADAYQQVADVTASVEEAAAMASESSKLIMDIPPSPSASSASSATPKAKAAPKKKNPAHKEGIFSPLVIAAGTILGPEQLNKIRAKVISLHSDIINRADVNGDGMISLEEFMDEAPKTLKTNLVKLAKNNGGDMGLLV
ncbi:hypothetical protein ACHAWC_006623 [Mediolabrus comicus]